MMSHSGLSDSGPSQPELATLNFKFNSPLSLSLGCRAARRLNLKFKFGSIANNYAIIVNIISMISSYDINYDKKCDIILQT